MNKKTKIEIVIIIIAAIVYFASMLGGKADDNSAANPANVPASIEAKADVSSGEAVQTDEQSIGYAEEEEETEYIVSGADAEDEEEMTDEPTLSEPPTTEHLVIYTEPAIEKVNTGGAVSENGAYTDKDSVALYIHCYNHLPDNFITKNEAKDAGWDSSKGNLNKVCPGKSIGGDHFGNYEGKLPKKKGRKYFECDINYKENQGKRGAERIIYSNDGLVYYTGDHYENFELLYGEP